MVQLLLMILMRSMQPAQCDAKLKTAILSDLYKRYTHESVRFLSITERQLQLCLNKLQQWATDNGFQFSKTKTVCMHICQKRRSHLDPQLFLDKRPIPLVEETKCLGVIFERKLSFVPHLKYVKKKGLKALNIF